MGAEDVVIFSDYSGFLSSSGLGGADLKISLAGGAVVAFKAAKGSFFSSFFSSVES